MNEQRKKAILTAMGAYDEAMVRISDSRLRLFYEEQRVLDALRTTLLADDLRAEFGGTMRCMTSEHGVRSVDELQELGYFDNAK